MCDFADRTHGNGGGYSAGRPRPGRECGTGGFGLQRRGLVAFGGYGHCMLTMADPHPASGQRRCLYPTCNRGSTPARHHLRIRALSAVQRRVDVCHCVDWEEAACKSVRRIYCGHIIAVTCRSRSQGRMRLWTPRASTRLSILSQGRWGHSALRVWPMEHLPPRYMVTRFMTRIQGVLACRLLVQRGSHHGETLIDSRTHSGVVRSRGSPPVRSLRQPGDGNPTQRREEDKSPTPGMTAPV
ncbi:hypothetical protein OH76DRAFT_1120819 [Lentinus brumalis]|uniref:Uncharacterized protein n=1 Tax=Lentinus brumalis TaxID=2498619 RepID=A0A371CUN5_9APHY|nr:hypothetical protein OH76DRAFT_1120819 [Polyporus brumalis]